MVAGFAGGPGDVQINGSAYILDPAFGGLQVAGSDLLLVRLLEPWPTLAPLPLAHLLSGWGVGKGAGGHQRTDLDGIEVAAQDSDERVLAVHDALERLAALEPEKAEVVKLRYFVGMSVEETAEALGISERTARRHWTFARGGSSTRSARE